MKEESGLSSSELFYKWTRGYLVRRQIMNMPVSDREVENMIDQGRRRRCINYLQGEDSHQLISKLNPRSENLTSMTPSTNSSSGDMYRKSFENAEPTSERTLISYDFEHYVSPNIRSDLTQDQNGQIKQNELSDPNNKTLIEKTCAQNESCEIYENVGTVVSATPSKEFGVQVTALTSDGYSVLDTDKCLSSVGLSLESFAVMKHKFDNGYLLTNETKYQNGLQIKMNKDSKNMQTLDPPWSHNNLICCADFANTLKSSDNYCGDRINEFRRQVQRSVDRTDSATLIRTLELNSTWPKPAGCDDVRLKPH